MRTYRLIGEVLENKDEIPFEIECGAVFIYPTDTVYGLGCNGLDSFAVGRIRRIKGSKKPFSIIAPSLKWIRENCFVEKRDEKYLKKFPGKYTLIFRLKNKAAICREVNLNLQTIGIRIPKHSISKLVSELGFPILTTSVNISGEKFLTELSELGKRMEKQIDFAIDAGALKGKPSRIIDTLTKKILRK